MSQQDSESDSDGSISPTSSTPSHSDENISPSSSTSEEGWIIYGVDCHHLGHIEAIPIKRGGSLKLVFNACIEHVAGLWAVHNSNYYGPDRDICFKLRRPGNNWIASISEPRAMDELRDIIRSGDTKGYKYHWYSKIKQVGDIVFQNFIIESYLEGDKKERVPEGLEMIPTLEERLGFMVL